MRYDGRVISMAILLVCGVNDAGMWVVLAIEPMLEESRESYSQLFEGLKARGLRAPSLVISDAHGGLVAAIRECIPSVSWQRCNVHFMRNILVHVPYKDKQVFSDRLKQIWLAPDTKTARKRADALVEEYEAKG